MNQRPAGQKITIDDVAARCGFSKATVSRVINQDGSVKPATAEKVGLAIKDLGYTPNLMARALSGGKTRTIAVVVPDIVNEYYTALLAGADAAAEEKGYNILVKTRNTKKALLDLVEGGRVDAFVLRNSGTQPLDPDLLTKLRRRDLPCLFVGKPPSDDAPAILVDNIGGARLMAHHYTEHGFRKILFIAGPEASIDSNDRLYGFKIGLSEKGLDPDNMILARGDFSKEAGYEAAAKYIPEVKPDAVFASNDQMALGVLLWCQDRGLRVPEDLGVTGYDDTFFAGYLQPALSTVQQPMYEIGAVAVERTSCGCSKARGRGNPGSSFRRSSRSAGPAAAGVEGEGCMKNSSKGNEILTRAYLPFHGIRPEPGKG